MRTRPSPQRSRLDTITPRQGKNFTMGEKTPLLAKKGDQHNRGSVRGSVAFPFYPSHRGGEGEGDTRGYKATVEPIEALSALAPGGVIKIAGVGKFSKPLSIGKSIPADAPYRRTARHRAFYLWWINEFRHWWKSSRLLVRLGGLETYAVLNWIDMTLLSATSRKAMKHAFKYAKRMGQAGVMRHFLKVCHPFTRSVRILVAAWRWVESAPCRRLEVGVEETLAFMGNRVSRMLARTAVDTFNKSTLATSRIVFRNEWLDAEIFWHPACLLVILGILRAVSPFGASFQGSRVGRVLTRSFFTNSRHRWLPIQRVNELNLKSDDCVEQDEIDENADLARLAKKVAKALGRSQTLGVDGMEEQIVALAEEGFRQVGSGSGGYAVYECHRKVHTKDGVAEHTLLLHVTPYGPSLLDVMPRYIVLELETSQDRRFAWSKSLASWKWNGPSLLEGYCYQGAFFSPHHFAEMKETYDKQLYAYDRACKSLSKVRTGRKPGPPTDLLSLKSFLGDAKFGRKRKQNAREMGELQKLVSQVARRLQSMMKEKSGCKAPKGVILYFEGLDCSGKSSTGGLIQQAMEQAGFDVEMRQHNRPPTEEQKRQPWMDRFESPDTSGTVTSEAENGNKGEKCDGHRHKAIVWDRGPAGDFVYGALVTATNEEKLARYREFMEFDKECKRKNILFCKLMFVTNRDSIASTLGKRLAQRKMAQDLKMWVKASRGTDDVDGTFAMEGLEAIDLHIDPTDFIAFNMYQKNLHMFANFAINTENPANPWVVVNTADRYNARKQLLSIFEGQLDAFGPRRGLFSCFGGSSPAETDDDTLGIEIPDMLNKELRRRMRTRTPLFFIALLVIIWYYIEHTTFGTSFDSFAWSKE